MKFERRDSDNTELKELTRMLQNVLSNVSLDNMSVQIIQGDIDADQEFKHKFGKRPAMWFPIEGDVFIPFGGLEEGKVTVSPRTAGKFKIAIIK